MPLSMYLILPELYLLSHNDLIHPQSNFSLHSDYCPTLYYTFHSDQPINFTTTLIHCYHLHSPSLINHLFLFSTIHYRYFNQLIQFKCVISNLVQVFLNFHLQRFLTFELKACQSINRHKNSCPWISRIFFVFVILRPNMHDLW